MSLEYIRSYYRVPAKRFARVEYTGGPGPPRQGKITGARGARLLIRFDDDGKTYVFHPTWEITYLLEEPRP